MKKIFKIMYILIVAIIIQMNLINVLAADADDESFTMDSIIDKGSTFLDAWDEKKNAAQANHENMDTITYRDAINQTSLQTASKSIYNVLFAVAVALATIVGMIIGIQFMMGSPEEQAKVKETLIPYVVGVFVVFGAFGIWRIVIGIGNSLG